MTTNTAPATFEPSAARKLALISSPSAHYQRPSHPVEAPRTDAAVKAAGDKRTVLIAWLTPYAVFLGLLLVHLLSS